MIISRSRAGSRAKRVDKHAPQRRRLQPFQRGERVEAARIYQKRKPVHVLLAPNRSI